MRTLRLENILQAWHGALPKRTLISALRILLGLVFIFSGMAKIFHLGAFMRTLAAYPFLPDWTLFYLAILIPMAEYFLGACLVLGLFLRWAIPSLLGLLLIFSGALVYQLLAGNAGSCGCFGGIVPEPGGWWAVLRNGTIAGLLGILVWFDKDMPKNK